MDFIDTLNAVVRTRTRDRLLLVFAKLFSTLLQRFSFNVLREACRYMSTGNFIASVLPKQSYIVIYDLETDYRSRLDTTIIFPVGTGCCLINEMDLLTIARNREKSVIRVGLIDGRLTQEESLAEPRNWTGLVAFGSFVFAFGGTAFEMTRSCEKFKLTTKEWTEFPDMTFPRACFTPCVSQARSTCPKSISDSKCSAPPPKPTDCSR